MPTCSASDRTTSIIVPGYEILFFWVARMILMSTFLLGDIPFKQVLLHGIVRDSKGQKFSKSLNNGVDPLDMTHKYGTDALRMALIFGAAPGNDVIFDEQKVKGMKHFGNKLWNIARFTLQNVEATDIQPFPEHYAPSPKEAQIISELGLLKEETNSTKNYSPNLNDSSLINAVITDAKKAILTLKWATKEMERRYETLESTSSRDIQSYHKNILIPALKKLEGKSEEEKAKAEVPESMPYIVIIVDELADLMSLYPRELEGAIVRLAQMSRAVGAPSPGPISRIHSSFFIWAESIMSLKAFSDLRKFCPKDFLCTNFSILLFSVFISRCWLLYTRDHYCTTTSSPVRKVGSREKLVLRAETENSIFEPVTLSIPLREACPINIGLSPIWLELGKNSSWK
jgi:hypothetical protein